MPFTTDPNREQVNRSRIVEIKADINRIENEFNAIDFNKLSNGRKDLQYRADKHSTEQRLVLLWNQLEDVRRYTLEPETHD